MVALIFTLSASGILAGLVQYFVDIRGLKTYEEPTNELNEDHNQSHWQIMWSFIISHWEFFGCLVLGIAGSFLVPVWNAITGGSLPGLTPMMEYTKCLQTNQGEEGTTPKCSYDTWNLLILFGYGIIFGYTAVRILRKAGSYFTASLAQTTAVIKKKNEDTERKMNQLTEVLNSQKEDIDEQKQTSYLLLELTKNPRLETPNSGDDYEAQSDSKIAGVMGECNANSTPFPWTHWRAAQSIKLLLAQVNAKAPNRLKRYDGIIGDTAHQTRNSDHNPQVWNDVEDIGIVSALDITHDVAGGCNCNVLAESLKSSQDARIKYLIWNSRILNSNSIDGSRPWEWRPYNGLNSHSHHMHISVNCTEVHYDDTSPWKINV
jgi:hypothetical protein